MKLYWVLLLAIFPQEIAAKGIASDFLQQNQSEAIKMAQQNVAEDPKNQRAWMKLARTYIAENQGKLALDALKHVNDSTQVPVVIVSLMKAKAHVLTGENENALSHLKESADAGLLSYTNLNEDEFWQSLRKRSEFNDILQIVHKNVFPCMHSERHRDFDFWIGEWEVYGNLEKEGPLFGRNNITQTQGGCLIMENWQSATGGTGTSMNFYDGLKQQWVQRWVDPSGTTIDYSGGLDIQGRMRLVGKIHYLNQENPIRDFRGTWTQLENGVVEQFFEESIDQGESWYPWFKGYYFRVTVEK